MVVRRKSKLYKRRGRQRTYGWGSSKKHRGKGSRGGWGMSGISGKRGQHRIQLLFNTGEKRGAPAGFKRAYVSKLEDKSAINIRDIELRLDDWIKEGAATKKGETFEVDLKKAGFDKVLGGGRATKKMFIKAASFSQGAKTKIEKAGGKAEAAEAAA